MLYDTDLLVWIFRGSAKAAGLIDADADRGVSVVSYMELIQGAANRRETRLIKSFLKDTEFAVLPLTESVGYRASIYMEEYAPSSGLRVADALIAATAAESRLALCTGDARHFRAIRELELSLFKP